MCRKNFYSVIFIFLVYFTIVKGSCLEYGHSCWGAHGKRSGGKALSAAANLRNGDFPILAEDNLNGIIGVKPPYDNLDELNASGENGRQRLANSDEVNTADGAKLKSLLRKHNVKFRNRNKNVAGNNNNNNNNNSNNFDDASLEQQRKRNDMELRWRKLPLFQLKTLAKPQLNVVAEADLLQQLERQAAAKAEEGYYDFK